MTKYSCLVPSLLLLSATAAFAQVPSMKEHAEGFRPMFNGKDFSGWRFGESSALPEKIPEIWKVEDEVIKLSGGGGPNLGSQWDYEDFEMRFEWRGMRDKYNSGYYIRSSRQVGSNQINLAKGDEGHFFGGKMNGGKAVPELQKPFGEWNEWRTRVVGDKVSFWCNGKLAWEGTEFESKRGYIGLQTEGAPLEFRNLRIQEIGFKHLDDDGAWQSVKDAKPGAKQTEDKFGDFVLRLEWQSAAGKSADIALRGAIAPKFAVRIGDLAEGSGGLPGLGIKPLKKLDTPAGQWNYLEARLIGKKLTVWLNGTTIVENAELKDDVPASGPLAILPGESALAVTNVRMKDLKK